MDSSIKARTVVKTKVHSHTRIEDGYRQIKQLIFEQNLVSCQKLLYDDLARMLHMARTPVIDALNRLEQQGLSPSLTGDSMKDQWTR